MNSLALGARGSFRQRITEPASESSRSDRLSARDLSTNVSPSSFRWLTNQPSHNHSSSE